MHCGPILFLLGGQRIARLLSNMVAVCDSFRAVGTQNVPLLIESVLSKETCIKWK